MKVRGLFHLKSFCFIFCLVAAADRAALAAVNWLPFGPDGGDARRVVPDPADHTHLYLGTTNGWLYESRTSGNTWRRLARIDRRDDLVLDSLVVDAKNAKHLIVGARVIGSSDGGIYTSPDGGRTWTSQPDMKGESVQSLRASSSDSNLLVAGTLKGVFRSADAGAHWTRISPPDSTEIHNIASVAIDPADPKIIYVGTWHLPWKTTDGGEHWENIKQGIIDDSDVFSIIIDPENAANVYASACSGIYKSENAGALFHKIQGIPSTARRTRVLFQDPNDLKIVFAGTTEGLWRSNDSGKTWNRTTGPEIIVNDVIIDKTDSKHVLIATDRGGVLSSEDGGDSFHSSNAGFSARQITALQRDRRRPGIVLAGVVNDKEWGGIFLSENGGLSWKQQSDGLQGRDVFSMTQAPDGTFIAGTAHGLFRWDAQASIWARVDSAPTGFAPPEVARAAVTKTRPPVPVGRNKYANQAGIPVGAHRTSHPAAVAGKGIAGAHLAAATPRKPVATGKKVSGPGPTVATHKPAARITTHKAQPSGSAPPPSNTAASLPLAVPDPSPASSKTFDGSVYALATTENTVLASTSIGLLASDDNGLTWRLVAADGSSDWRYLAAAKEDVVAASLHSVAFSADAGRTWGTMQLPDGLTQVGAVSVEPSGRIWVGGREGVFTSQDAGHHWSTPKNLFLHLVNSLFYDDTTSRMLVTTSGYTSILFTVHLPDLAVSFIDTGWNLREARPIGDHFIAATQFDGLVIQPRMIASPMGTESKTESKNGSNPGPPAVRGANPAPPNQ